MNLQKIPAMLPETEKLGMVSAWIPFDKAKAGFYKMEIWKDIPGFENRYQISNFGRIKSLMRYENCTHNSKRIVKGRILKQYNKEGGYKRIVLRKNGIAQICSIHRLVGLVFIENSLKKPCINHKDGNKLNNHISNLEWVTRSENSLHMCHILGILPRLGTRQSEETKRKIGNANAKLTKNQVNDIRMKYKINYTCAELAKEYNVTQQTIYVIIRNSNYGYRFN